MQCTDDELWNCAPEMCTILLTNVTPINSTIKKGKKETGPVKLSPYPRPPREGMAGPTGLSLLFRCS